MTLATWITLTRLFGIPILLYALDQPTVRSQWLAVGVFLVAASTDWLDGYVARRFNQVTDLGKFLDPLVDKLLVITPLLSLTSLGKVPVLGVFLIIARELTIAGWRVNQRTISGANLWGKLKTVVQIIAIALLMAPLPEPVPKLGILFFWFAVALTLISGWIYLRPAVGGSSGATSKAIETTELNALRSLPSPDPIELASLQQNLALIEHLHTFKSGFLSRVSHELRAPLNGIIGTHQLILSDLCDSPEEEREFLQHANTSTLNLLAMLDTILKVAKVEAGKTPLNLKACSVWDLLQDVGDLTTLQARDRTIPLNVVLPEQDFQIWADEAWLRQMLLHSIIDLMQALSDRAQQRGALQISAIPLPDVGQVRIQVAAELPFVAITEPIETLTTIHQPSEPQNGQPEIPFQLSPVLQQWLDQTMMEHMQGKLEYLEQPLGWTCLQFTVPLASR